jgi:hypothetical protein
MHHTMHQFVKAALAAAALALALFTPTAHAGRSCEAAKPPPAKTIEQGMALAERMLKALNAENAQNGTQVVVLARAGQNLDKYSLRYSHLGFAYKAADGRWLITHKLNTCGTAQASLYRQGLGEFFMDDLYRYEAAWVVPTPEVQAKLYPLLQSNPRTSALHIKAYSMLSYPWATKYQQSNQWAIETLASAMEDSIQNRTQAQAWLQFKGYEPTTLNIGALTRLGGRLTAANIAFDDHPNEKRFADRIETVTVDSVFRWLQRAGLSGKLSVINLS